MRLPNLHSHPGRRAWHRSSTRPAGARKDRVAAAPKQPPPDPPGRSAHQRRLRNGIAFAAVLSVLMGALILAVPGLRTVAHRLAHASPGWIALGVALELASCVGYVVAFALVFPAPPGRVAARIAWAEMGFGAVVPIGGAGGFALGGWMLHQQGLSIREIARRSAVLFWLTSAVNVCALILAGLALATAVLPGPRNPLLTLVPAAVGTLVLVCFHALPTITGGTGQHGRIGAALRATAVTVTDTERLLRRSSWRLAGALAYLGADMAVLWVSFEATGVAPPVAVLVLAYLIGYLANVLPVPGGIGILDGGIVGALVLYHTPAASAAAAVLLYHTIALWIPTLGGAIAFASSWTPPARESAGRGTRLFALLPFRARDSRSVRSGH
jgi:uncharacterized membrane protein YbhN (UPF0104 family)